MKITRFITDNGKKIVHASYTKEEINEIRKRARKQKEEMEKKKQLEQNSDDGNTSSQNEAQ